MKIALTMTGIEELKTKRERTAVEIMKLAKNRHTELLKGASKKWRARKDSNL